MGRIINKIRVNKRKGMYLPVILLVSTLFMAFATAIIALSMSNVKIANLHNKKITSMSIAEAGINYYMWHLAHDNADFCDGNACTGSAPYGPYQHVYTDAAGHSLGTYDLYITPPSTNSNITTVKSVGKVNGKSPTRTIIATVGMPSYTRYALLGINSELWIGPGEEIDGSVHSNYSGIYNEGQVTGDASSTELEFSSTHAGQQAGVSGPGIFKGAKLFPVTAVDINRIDVDIRRLRDGARDLGEGQYYDQSSSKGYHVVFKSNSYDLYKVKRYDSTGLNIIEETLLGNHSYPEKGVIFFADNVWINGMIDGQKVTVVAADPEANSGQRKRIILPDTLKYTNYDGDDKIGLISQTDILLPKTAPDYMEIDAAMIAKDGQIKIGTYKFDHKSHIKVYGSMAHKGGLLWTYDYGGGYWSGYQTTETIMDQHNVLNPPPKFPLTGAYAILSWREE